MARIIRCVLSSISVVLFAISGVAQQVRTDSGVLEGKTEANGIYAFLGVPFAAPPVGELRWREPQPVKAWSGVRNAREFGARCVQARVFNDMVFRDGGPSEDCLYLNVWTSTINANAKLPVMVWVYGGGFQAGATSEPRQDGQFLARRGVVVVSMNYRLGVFGFFSHPELTKESPHHASGNYGLMDQAAALQWVKRNIAAFGGDPNNVTIFGESAGSFSVSGLMASPVSKNLLARAIGESGAFLARDARLKPLAASEQDGEAFANGIGAHSIAELRAIPAQQLPDDVTKANAYRFWPNIDGYFFPDSPQDIYARGDQAHVPLLAGWNRDESGPERFFGKEPATKETYLSKIRQRFGADADTILKYFPANSDEQAQGSAAELSTADFIAYGTWKWIEEQQQSGARVYRFEFDQPPPAGKDATSPSAGKRAYHSAEIEFVFGTLDSKNLPWRPEDYKLSELMGTYWTNFAKTGDPNGKDLPRWPVYSPKDGYEVLHLSPAPAVKPDQKRDQFIALDRAYAAAANAANK